MNTKFEELRKQVLQAPEKPGVYRWFNAKGDIVYVGKAKNLRNRMKSYVQKEPDKNLGPWKLSLIKHIADFDITVTSTELEALILETNLIKEVQPKYNVLMKDGKNYVYVRISIQEQYPAISIVRKVEKDGAKYFGPYLSAYNIKRTLDMLSVVFRYRACSASVDALNRGKKPDHACLEYQIGQCNGLCVGDVSQKQYRESIEEIIRFLKGDYASATLSLKDMMETAAEQKKFEKAAKLRDILKYIASLSEQQIVSDTSHEDTDAIGIVIEREKVQVVVLRERNGRVIDERSFSIAGSSDDPGDALSQLIPQLYSTATDIPDLIVIPEQPQGSDVLEEWLSHMRGKNVKLRAAERGKKSKLLAMAQANAKQKIVQQFAKWEAASKNIEEALNDLKDILELPSIPKRIEGYDISHLGGTETVGSMVVIKNGKAANADYRSFTLRTVIEGEIDDYKALKEVLRRRLRYLSNEEEKLKEQGITFGKARKSEQEEIEKIAAQAEELNEEHIDYKDFLVARNTEKIIAMGRLLKHPTKEIEIKSIWTDPEFRNQGIASLLLQKLLAKAKREKQKKVYIRIFLDMEEYYSARGFLRVKKRPPTIEKEVLETRKTNPDIQGATMVYIFADHKEDTSLSSTPDLLVIDGGKGQLSAVKEILDDMQMDIPVIGLAKREEEVFIPGSSLPVDLPKNSQASFLLQRLRNEAHRFANAHREKRIAKGLIGSALDAVPGIGEKTKKELLQKFGSVDGIKKATDTQLLTVINPQKLKALRKTLA